MTTSQATKAIAMIVTVTSRGLSLTLPPRAR